VFILVFTIPSLLANISYTACISNYGLKASNLFITFPFTLYADVWYRFCMAAVKRRCPAPLLLESLLLLSYLSCTNAQSLSCTRVVDGDTIIVSNGEKVRRTSIQAFSSGMQSELFI
jgi:hypothetical protein